MSAAQGKRPYNAAYFGALLALTILYFIIAKISLIPAPSHGNASPIWPPTGVGIAVLLMLGVRYWPFIAIGAFATVISTSAGWGAAVGIAIGNTLESVVAALLLTRVARFDLRMDRVRDVVWLMLIGGLLAPLISTTIGVISLQAAGQISVLAEDWLVWWAGNVAGCLLAAPLALSWSRGPFQSPTPTRLVEALALTVCAGVLAQLVFGFLTGVGTFAYPLSFAMFPPLVWASIRFGHRGSSAIAFLYACVAVIGTMQGSGPFTGQVESVSGRVAILAAFMFALSGTGLVLSAVVRERLAAAEAQVTVESKYHSLIEQASDGIFITDLVGGYMEANTRGQEMLGYTVDELRRLSIQELIVIDEHDRVPPRTNDLQTGQHVLSERRLRRKDGSHISVEISAKKLRDGRFLAIVRDVSERKRAEKQRSLMMRELDHRVKNNLAIVLSIADQTIKSVSSVSEFSERFVGRIMALARVHGLLAQSSWAGADLAALVTRTLKPYAESQTSRVRIEGDACRIPSRAAGPLCMTLHELATNAAKYGAFSTAAGTVEVKWAQQQGADAKPHLRLTWTELGGPPVREPMNRGFGTQLIEHGLVHEVGACVKLEFRSTGVRCEIDFSLAVDPKVEPDHDALPF